MTTDKNSPRPEPTQTGTRGPTANRPQYTSGSAFGLLTCPDCAAVAQHGEFPHDETCPAAAAMDRVQEDDAAWFRANPREHVRYRRMADAEGVEAEASGVCRPQTGSAVEVTQLRPGLRARRFLSGGDTR